MTDIPSNSLQPQQRPSEVKYSGGTLFNFNNVTSITRQQAQDGYLAVGGLMYQGVWDPDLLKWVMDDPRYEGRTVQEVITMKHAEKALTGDLAAINSWQDRVLGKPKQSVEAVSVGVSFTEYLDYLHGLDTKEADPYTGVTVDVTPQPSVPHVQRVNIDWDSV